MKKPNVLVTTMGSWSSLTGSNTMSSLMQEYGSENVAVLYIRADLSDSRSASRYFHIFEGRVLKSILKSGLQTGEEFRPEEINVAVKSSDQSMENARYAFFKKYRLGIFLFVREFVWLLGKWKSKELDAFLDDVNPDVLVCPIESYIHFNRINEYIIKRKHPKVISFLWDDNFTYKQNHNLWHQLHRLWLRQSVRRMVHNSERIVSLSPKMKREVDAEFGVNSVLITKPIYNLSEFKEYKTSFPLRLLYTGSLYVNRDKTIATIVEAIQEVNSKEQKVILDVYTASQIQPAMERKIKVEGCCVVHEPVKQEEVLELQKHADVLLFVEDLESKTGGDARLSFSTKITDYLCSGKCIWAVGSKEMSAIEYLYDMDAALCSMNKESIKSHLNSLLDNKIVNSYAFKAWKCGNERHGASSTTEKLYHLIEGS